MIQYYNNMKRNGLTITWLRHPKEKEGGSKALFINHKL